MTSEVSPSPNPHLFYSSCMRRFGASLVDTLILMVFYIAVPRTLGFKAEDYQLAFQFITLLYYVSFESSAWRATPGKRALGIYLADTAGNRISPLRVLARYLILCAPSMPMILMLTSDKFKAFQSSMDKANELAPAERQAAMSAAFHDNTIFLGQYLIIVGGALVLLIALYWLPMIFTKQKTGLHDMLTKVRVLRKM